jgi:hypothetical protein
MVQCLLVQWYVLPRGTIESVLSGSDGVLHGLAVNQANISDEMLLKVATVSRYEDEVRRAAAKRLRQRSESNGIAAA